MRCSGRLYFYALAITLFGTWLISAGLGLRSPQRVQPMEQPDRSTVLVRQSDSSANTGRVAEAGCLDAPRCLGTPVPVTVYQLVEHANRHDRRLVRVHGIPIMVKPRRSRCGDYHYFVLKDREGYHISITDYTDKSEALERRGEIALVGYYRAELHQLDVCRSEKPHQYGTDYVNKRGVHADAGSDAISLR